MVPCGLMAITEVPCIMNRTAMGNGRNSHMPRNHRWNWTVRPMPTIFVMMMKIISHSPGIYLELLKPMERNNCCLTIRPHRLAVQKSSYRSAISGTVLKQIRNMDKEWQQRFD